MHLVYLDEFGHIGPFVSRTHSTYRESPVFGMAGYILPAEQARDFSTWFYKRKCELLAYEISRDNEHPAIWEKKGSSLYTTRNVLNYRELRVFTNRLLSKIENCGGRVIYFGMHKQSPVEDHKPLRLYSAVLKELIKRLNALCEHDDARSDFLIVMDQHQERDAILTAASRAMFARERPQRRLIEPPYQVESHRYQTVQAADWICGLIGRLTAFRAAPSEFSEFEWAETYFGSRVQRVCLASGIKGDKRLHSTTLIAEKIAVPLSVR